MLFRSIRILETLGLASVKRIAPRPKFIAQRSHIDLDAMQAVIHHRYDMMAAYARTIRQECKNELARLDVIRQSDASLAEAARNWLHIDYSRWPEAQKAKLASFLESNERMRQLVQMRDELAVVWGRSNDTREQLLGQFQSWCQRAEASGIKTLQDLSVRAKSYAM